jgi:hypothetical protein
MLNHTYSFLGVETYKQVSTEKIPAGPVTVKMLFEADKPEPGTGGTVTLWANGTPIGEGKMPHTVPVALSSYAGMDIGRDNGLVVDRAYEDKAPYAFTRTVKGRLRPQAGHPPRRAGPARTRPGAGHRSGSRRLKVAERVNVSRSRRRWVHRPRRTGWYRPNSLSEPTDVLAQAKARG